MQDTIAKFKEEKRKEFVSLTDWPDKGAVADYWLSKMPELLTLLEEQVGEDVEILEHYDICWVKTGRSVNEECICGEVKSFRKHTNQERQRIRNLLSLTKQQF